MVVGLSSDDIIPLTIASISVQGCRTEGGKLARTGTKCVLKFEWEERKFESEAEVAWRGHNGSAGLRFLSISEENLALLRDLCETLRLEPLTRKGPR